MKCWFHGEIVDVSHISREVLLALREFDPDRIISALKLNGEWVLAPAVQLRPVEVDANPGIIGEHLDD